MNTITLGAKQVYDPPEGSAAFTNTFTMHTGASRPGMGRFLMLRSDYDAIAGKATKALIMDCEQGDSLNMQVVIAGATPAFPGVTTGKDVVEVVVFDVRAKLIRPYEKAFNMGILGINPPKFYTSTYFSGTTPWTWEQLVTDLEVDFENATLPSTWKPRNVNWDNVAKSRVIDDVAARLFLISGFDGTTVKYFDPDAQSEYNRELLSTAAPYLLKGGDTTRNAAARLPGTIRVTFAGIDASSSDPYASAGRLYTKDVATGVGDSAIIQSLHVGEYQAIRSSGAWANQTELDAVAADMAQRCVAAMASEFSEAEYAGIWFFDLDGYVRGIRWVSDSQGARTIIRVNNDRDFHALGELQRANETLQNTLVAGLGETRVSMTAGGTRSVWQLSTTNLKFGTVTGGDWSSGTHVDLNPSDIHGTPTGEDTVSVYIKADQSSYTMANSTNVPQDTVVPYIKAADGNYYVLGDPTTFKTFDRWNLTDGKFQMKTRDTWGAFHGTESDWVDWDAEYTDCVPDEEE